MNQTLTLLSLTISSHLTAVAPVSTSPNSTWIFLFASQSIFSFRSNLWWLSNVSLSFFPFLSLTVTATAPIALRSGPRNLSSRSRSYDRCLTLSKAAVSVDSSVVDRRDLFGHPRGGDGWVTLTHLTVTRNPGVVARLHVNNLPSSLRFHVAAFLVIARHRRPRDLAVPHASCMALWHPASRDRDPKMVRDAGVVYLLIVIVHLCSCARNINYKYYNECKSNLTFVQLGRKHSPFPSRQLTSVV